MLRDELNKFWKWAELNYDEYVKGIPPKNPEAYSAEWETDYENWDDIEDTFKNEITKINKNEKSNFNDIFEAISIDNEAGRLSIFAITDLSSSKLNDFLIEGISNPDDNIRIQIAMQFNRSKILQGEYYLTMILEREDEIPSVIGPALCGMLEYDKKHAEKYAFKYLKHPDYHIRRNCLTILKLLNSPLYENAKQLLKDDPSPYIQKDLKE